MAARDRLAWYPTLGVGLAMVSFILFKTSRDAAFFSGQELSRLPLAFVAIAIASMPVAMLHIAAIRSFGPRRTRVAVLLSATTIFLPFVWLVEAGNSKVVLAFFVLVPVIFGAIFASIWLLAGDLLDGIDAGSRRRFYSRIGASSMIGGMIGAATARGFGGLVGSGGLLLVGCATLLAVTVLVWRAQQLAPPRMLSPGDGAQTPWATSLRLMSNRYVLGLMGLSAAGALAALLIDFQFYAAAMFTGNTSVDFFAGFYLVLNVAGLFIQLTLAPRLQSLMGVAGALLLLPIVLLGGAAVLVFSATLMSRSTLKVTESSIKSAVHRSIWEQVFVPLDHSQRGVAKALVDGMAARMAQGAGGLILYWWLLERDLSAPILLALNVSLVTVVAVWLALNFHMIRRGCASAAPLEELARLTDG